MSEPVIEKLADLAHRQWSGWTAWMLEKMHEHHPSGEHYEDRWRRQIQTAYGGLSEDEKESDRIEARKVLAEIQPDLAPMQDFIVNYARHAKGCQRARCARTVCATCVCSCGLDAAMEAAIATAFPFNGRGSVDGEGGRGA